jgi:hypothetical protein
MRSTWDEYIGRPPASRPVWVQVGDEIAAQQERVGGIRAVDGQRIAAIVRRARILHVDDVVGRAAGDVDEVRVGAATAIEVDRVADDFRAADRVVIRPVVRGRHRWQTVEDDRVGAAGEAVGVTEHAGMPTRTCGLR